MSAEEAAGQTRYLPCRWCDVATPYATMSALGARCSRCFAEYCQTKPVLPEGRIPQGRSPEWIKRKARAQSLLGASETAPPVLAPPVPQRALPDCAGAPDLLPTDDAPAWVYDDAGAAP